MRSPAFVLLLISFFCVTFARSQSNELIIQGQTGKLYLEHTVAAKENWYSIGRLYNANPKTVALLNHLVMTQPLNIGQTLQIPLTAVNFSQTGQKVPSETLIPVYHVIQEKEWFYRISVNHNKVPIPSLEKWNNINKDQAKPGMHLIVGYLKVKTALSALAAVNKAPAVAASSPDPHTGVNPSVTENPPVNAKTDRSAAPVKTDPAPTVTKSNPQQPTGGNTNPPPASMNTTTSAAVTPSIHFNGGFFKADYSETGKSVPGTAGTFKSTSGWQDGKYYALMNNIPIGTIVKVSVPGTDKSVYAKILGQLPDMKESAGLAIRISNAAASELGTGEGRFNVETKY